MGSEPQCVGTWPASLAKGASVGGGLNRIVPRARHRSTAFPPRPAGGALNHPRPDRAPAGGLVPQGPTPGSQRVGRPSEVHDQGLAGHDHHGIVLGRAAELAAAGVRP
jgi:hypothetical protein